MPNRVRSGTTPCQLALAVAASVLATPAPSLAAELNLLADGDFSQAGAAFGVGASGSYSIGSASLLQAGSAPVRGWQTTASDNQIEIWSSGFQNVPSPEGTTYFAELNAYFASTLFQVVQLSQSEPVGYSLAHRGRLGVDVMDLKVYHLGAATSWSPGQGTLVYSERFSDGVSSWGYHGDGNMFSPVAGAYYAFTFVSVSSTGGDAVGNFLGDVKFGYGVGAVPEASLGWVAASAILVGAGVARRYRRRVTR